MSKWTEDKGCYCHTCDMAFHYLGIATHRASHRDRGEVCEITYTSGETFVHDYRFMKAVG